MSAMNKARSDKLSEHGVQMMRKCAWSKRFSTLSGLLAGEYQDKELAKLR